MLYGGDEFSAAAALVGIKARLGPGEALDPNTNVLDGHRLTPDELAMVCNTIPFLGDHRLVIVEGLLERMERGQGRRQGSRGKEQARAAGEWSGLPEMVETMAPATTLVIMGGVIGAGNPLLKALGSVAQVRRFDPLRGPRLQDWIVQRAKAREAALSARAVQLLAEFSGGNLRLLDQELAKLALYAGARTIEEEDVAGLVSSVKEASIFEMVDAFVEGQPGAAMRALDRLLEQGTPAPLILTMLARQLRLMVQAKSLEARNVGQSGMASALGLRSDYVLRKTVQQSRSYSLEALKSLYRRLEETDLAIKTGRVAEDLGLEMLVAGTMVRG